MIKLEIELSDRGAEVLAFILGLVGGDPDGPRKVTDAIQKKLEPYGGTWTDRKKYMGVNPGYNNSVYLADEWPDSGPDCKATVKEKP